MSSKRLNFLLEGIVVQHTKNKGRGVFTLNPIPAGTVIEMAPVIVLRKGEREFIDKTLLHDYIFEWGEKRELCCMALGIIPIYNHSYTANCEYEMYFTREVITIKTVRDIKAKEELFINYNGDWDNNSKVWFDVK